MAIVIGIDAGISMIKIVRINDDGTVVVPIHTKATDPVISLYGALSKYLYDNETSLDEVEQMMPTSVGAAYVDDPVYGLSTVKAEELTCNGLGAQFETELDDIIVVSMGIGTSFIQCLGDDIRHIEDMGLGDGTLIGLSCIMPKTDDIKQISMLTMQGEGSNIDVRIGDISPNPLPNLPKTATASLFGNAKGNTSREDITLDIITVVLQTIGSSTILASLGMGIKDYVPTGNLTLLPQCKSIFDGMEKLYGVNFIIPKHSEFYTAINAVLCFIDKKRK